MSTRFVHLHCHTEYSLVDSVIRIDDLIKAVRAADMPACAVTDCNNLFALVKFYRAAQAKGIKAIIGADVLLHHDAESPTRLVLLCQNDIGYRNLTRLISRSYTEGQRDKQPYVHKTWLQGATDGLIALSGGREGNVGQALLMGHIETARQYLDEWQHLFPQRFYLELQRTGRPQEEEYIHAAVELALATNTPVVATNDVCFLSSDDFETHEVRVCIHEGYVLNDTRRTRRYSPQQYLRTPQEMAELFSDIPEAIENTWLIAQRCNLHLALGKNFLPDFPVPDGKTLSEYFREQARLGLEQRLAKLFDNTAPQFAEQRAPYDARLQLELDVIEQMGFPGYFLIVADFIQWAKDNNIPVGPGRGSGAGSLVAYALNITDLDPLHYELLFERFLNPERVSMPDFDIDFCMEGRDDVIDYVAKRYGRHRVAQIITYGTMAAKAVVRDVGRVLDHPYGFVDKIAKLIPFELGITLEKALVDEEALRVRYEKEEEVRELLDIAKKLEGLTRNVGTHAGGVVIAPSELVNFTPLYCEEGSQDLVTQFDKDDIESIGLVKFDFLGLRTLTIIKSAVDIINRSTEKPLDINAIKLDDAKTFELLQSSNTTAIFQLESRGIKELIKRLQPDCFEDIVALVALYRPGPLQSGMVDDFIARKHGKAKIEYPHPTLAPILKPTYGVILYQEQVMQIAQVLAGYTLGGADLLRRAMGKKKPEEMAKQRSIFVEGAKKHAAQEETATYIFDLMEKFAGYGFNRSHSAAYALVTYQTAWLKTHYPAAFMAAVLSADMDNTDKVVHLIEECRAMQLNLIPPHVNHSEYKFAVKDYQNDSIHYGLGAIRGAGEIAIEVIVKEREKQGEFQDLFDFCRRIDLRKVNRRVLEALIKAGALDNLGATRSILMASLDSAVKFAEQQSVNLAVGQNDMFGLSSGNVVPLTKTKYIQASEWSMTEKLNAEKDSLGFYLSGHPVNEYLPELKQLTDTRLVEVHRAKHKENPRLAGWVTDIRMTQTKRGRMAIVTLEDNTAQLEVTLYSELYLKVQDWLAKEKVLIVEGEIREDKFTGNWAMNANKVFDLASARENLAKRLILTVINPNANLAQQLAEALKPHCQSGRCAVRIDYQRTDAQVELVLSDAWQVQINEILLEKLKSLLGADKVKVFY